MKPDEIKYGLRYIANSPPREHGGFHPQAVEIAKEALKYIAQLEAASSGSQT